MTVMTVKRAATTTTMARPQPDAVNTGDATGAGQDAMIAIGAAGLLALAGAALLGRRRLLAGVTTDA